MTDNTEQAIPEQVLAWIKENTPTVECGLDITDHAHDVGVQRGWRTGAKSMYREMSTEIAQLKKELADHKAAIADILENGGGMRCTEDRSRMYNIAIKVHNKYCSPQTTKDNG